MMRFAVLVVALAPFGVCAQDAADTSDRLFLGQREEVKGALTEYTSDGMLVLKQGAKVDRYTRQTAISRHLSPSHRLHAELNYLVNSSSYHLGFSLTDLNGVGQSDAVV